MFDRASRKLGLEQVWLVKKGCLSRDATVLIFVLFLLGSIGASYVRRGGNGRESAKQCQARR